MIYHLAWRSGWNAGRLNGTYHPGSLQAEGFIHCTREPEKLLEVADLFFAPRDDDDLLLVSLDESKIGSEIRYEDPGVGHVFPHVYGPIDLNAVVDASVMTRHGDRWFLPEGIT